MKIALLSHEYPPHIFGGIGAFTKELALGLHRKGVDVNVIAGYPSGSESRQGVYTIEENGIPVTRFPYPSIPPRQTFFQLVNCKKVIEKIRTLGVDVIHGQCSSTYPLIQKIKREIPVLVTFHASPLNQKIFSTQSIFRGGSKQDFSTFLLGYPVWHYVYAKELQNSDLAVTVSKSLQVDLIRELGKKYGQKTTYIHNGVDLQSLDSVYNKYEDIEESEDTIVYAGRLYWSKGALEVLKIAYMLQKRNSRFKIIVHGSGPLFKKMQEKIRLLKLRNIELKGWATKTQLMKTLKSAKYILLPSFYEACPMILLESMCLGKIPLLFNLPYSNELAQNGKYAIIGDNTEDLVNKLTSYENSSLSAFSQSIRSFARNAYNMDRVTAEYIESYKNICE